MSPDGEFYVGVTGLEVPTGPVKKTLPLSSASSVYRSRSRGVGRTKWRRDPRSSIVDVVLLNPKKRVVLLKGRSFLPDWDPVSTVDRDPNPGV